jgi:hypothetical protein
MEPVLDYSTPAKRQGMFGGLSGTFLVVVVVLLPVLLVLLARLLTD